MTIQKLKVIGALTTPLIVAGIITGYAYVEKNTESIESGAIVKVGQVQGPYLVVAPAEYDFGTVKQSGGIVSTAFDLYNGGDENVVIASTPASCSCTSASVDKMTLAPGEHGRLIVRFDPNYHYEDEGKFFRTVTIKSNASGPAPEAKIWVEVLYDLGKDKLKFGK